jgi:UDP-4-amino-4-deoxy-L-arabinose-oxoglutarate aminotransferase
MSSWTTGAFLALKALGIGTGDEVITTPFTFIASANIVLHCGATPVLVDVMPGTGNIDPEQVESAVTERTKAILPVHLYGQMADMRALRVFADRHDLYLIEDAAHCVEGQRDGYRPGQLSDAVGFSFYATKNLACGEGGAIATNNEDLAERLYVLRLHGMDKSAAERYTATYRHWDMIELGYKANMFDLQAAMLLPQLARIDDMRTRREEICQIYETAFGQIEGVDFPKVLPDSTSARHLFTIWVEPDIRDAVLYNLQQQEVGVAVNFRAIHLLSYYRERFGYERSAFPVAERIGDSTITLPLYPSLTSSEIEYVIDAVGKAVEDAIVAHKAAS